jgi:hypothetical protein
VATHEHHQESGDLEDGGITVSAPEPEYMDEQSDPTVGGWYFIKFSSGQRGLHILDTILIQDRPLFMDRCLFNKQWNVLKGNISEIHPNTMRNQIAIVGKSGTCLQLKEKKRTTF